MQYYNKNSYRKCSCSIDYNYAATTLKLVTLYIYSYFYYSVAFVGYCREYPTNGF